MLEHVIQQLEQHLSERLLVLDVILRTEHSLMEAEEYHEVEFQLGADEETVNAGGATAKLHLLPLEPGFFELEAEVELAGTPSSADGLATLFALAEQVRPDISLTEKRRFLSAEELSSQHTVLDFHFVLDYKQDASAVAAQFTQLAKDLRFLLNLTV